jgi:hypothetical protein
MANETRPYIGQGSLLKRNTGGGPLANGSQRNLFFTEATLMNPYNFAYPSAVNASSFPSQDVLGMRTPMVHLQACLKPRVAAGNGWSDADLFNSLINVYTNYNSDQFALAFVDDRYTVTSGNLVNAGTGFGAGIRIWDWARCESLTFSQDALGGPIMVSLAFKSRSGESNWSNDNTFGGGTLYTATNTVSGEAYPSAPVFAALTTDAGQETNLSQVDFNGTLGDVRRWSLTLLRGQTYERYLDGTIYPSEISSKMFSGILEVHQNPRNATYVTGTGTLRININSDKTISTGRFRIDMKVNTDNNQLNQTTQAGNLVSTFSLIDLTSGGNPAAITAY